MKKIVILMVLCMTVVTISAQAPENLYPSASGKLAYQFEFEGVETTYTLVFDAYGKKQAFELASLVDGYAQKTKTIITPETMYVINYEDQQVIKFPIGIDDTSMELYGGNKGGFDLSDLVLDVTKEAADKKGTAVVLGKTCDIYEVTDEIGEQGKYWIYNNYLFKAEFIDEEGQHAFMEITSFDIDTPIDKTEFEVPADFEITDMTEMMDQMKKMQEMYGVPTEE